MHFIKIKKFDQPIMVMALGTIGFVVGAIIVLHPIVTVLRESRAFLSQPYVVVWILMYCIQLAFYFVILGPVLKFVIQLKQYFKGNRSKIVISTVNLVILILAIPLATRYVLPYFNDMGNDLPNVFIKLSVLMVIGVLITALVAVGIRLVYAGLLDSNWETEPKEDLFKRYLLFRGHLQYFIWIAGIMLGSSILAAGALSKVHISMGRDYSPIFVLSYGACLTIILFMFYIPVYISMNSVGRKLCESSVPLPLPDSDLWEDSYNKRKSVEQYLQVNITASKNLQTNVAILIPLLSGITSTLIGM